MSFTERQCDAMDARRDQQKEDRLNKRQPSLSIIASHRPDPSHSYDVQRVISGARVDAMVDHACQRSCDPRGAFIKRPEYSEGWWLLYKESYIETAESLAAQERAK